MISAATWGACSRPKVHRCADVVVVLGDPIAPFVLIRPVAKVRIGPSDQRGERVGMALLQIEP